MMSQQNPCANDDVGAVNPTRHTSVVAGESEAAHGGEGGDDASAVAARLPPAPLPPPAAAADEQVPTVFGGEVDDEMFEKVKAESQAQREAKLLAKRRPGRAVSSPSATWYEWGVALASRFTHAWDPQARKTHGGYDGKDQDGERGCGTGI